MIPYLFRFPSVLLDHPETHRGVVGTRHKLIPNLINNIQYRKFHEQKNLKTINKIEFPDAALIIRG